MWPHKYPFRCIFQRLLKSPISREFFRDISPLFHRNNESILRMISPCFVRKGKKGGKESKSVPRGETEKEEISFWLPPKKNSPNSAPAENENSKQLLI
ncbi:hypothetical protein CEXT_408561 [Caerostris extrusa]|uniref:Uncharacterized protein n=1 Tax=Caerostris extrusa TaxID=172846 RepID=A0AAV4MJ33_CAEEX|nr:hypothetical protein CEXT_408561 [Caerostris extrusa]